MKYHPHVHLIKRQIRRRIYTRTRNLFHSDDRVKKLSIFNIFWSFSCLMLFILIEQKNLSLHDHLHDNLSYNRLPSLSFHFVFQFSCPNDPFSLYFSHYMHNILMVNIFIWNWDVMQSNKHKRVLHINKMMMMMLYVCNIDNFYYYFPTAENKIIFCNKANTHMIIIMIFEVNSMNNKKIIN